IIPAERLATLGLPQTGPVALAAWPAAQSWLAEAVNPLQNSLSATPALSPGNALHAAATQLLKHAGLPPYALATPATTLDARWLHVTLADLAAYPIQQAAHLSPVSDAIIPLHGIGPVRVIAFRPLTGGLEHLAILTGALAADGPVAPPPHPVPV